MTREGGKETRHLVGQEHDALDVRHGALEEALVGALGSELAVLVRHKVGVDLAVPVWAVVPHKVTVPPLLRGPAEVGADECPALLR